MGRDAGWRRRVAPVILAVAVYPVVHSLNRGLWIALIAMLAFTAIRFAVIGRVRLLFGLITAVILVGIVVSVTSLEATIVNRFANGYSNSGRVNLSAQSVDVVAHSSPIIGLGTTRDVVGSFQSIAGASTASCPLCAPPALGTQGHFWLVIFTTGIVGLIIYLGFFVQMIGRSLRLRSPYVAMSLAVIVGHIVTMWVYDTIGIAMITIFTAIGLLWRETEDGMLSARQRRWPIIPNPTLGGYLGLIRDHRAIVAACLAIGVASGGLWQYRQGVTTTATAQVELPRDPVYPDESHRTDTLDTLGQLLKTPDVARAVTEAVGRPINLESELTIGAAPNSRILYVKVTDLDGHDASIAATAAAKQLIEVRDGQLQRRQLRVLARLRNREAELMKAMIELDRLQRAASDAHSDKLTRIYIPIHFALLARQTAANLDTTSVLATRPVSGTLLGPAHTHQRRDVWRVSLGSGLMLGLLAGIWVARLRDIISPRVGRGRKTSRLTGLDVVATIELPARAGRPDPLGMLSERVSQLLARHAVVLRAYRANTCVSAGDDPSAQWVAGELDRLFENSGYRRVRVDRNDVLMVVTPRTRVREIIRLNDRLQKSHARAVGLIIAKASSGTI
jgi:hypothetical protein